MQVIRADAIALLRSGMQSSTFVLNRFIVNLNNIIASIILFILLILFPHSIISYYNSILNAWVSMATDFSCIHDGGSVEMGAKRDPADNEVLERDVELRYILITFRP